jgi:hypothetical protein
MKYKGKKYKRCVIDVEGWACQRCDINGDCSPKRTASVRRRMIRRVTQDSTGRSYEA